MVGGDTRGNLLGADVVAHHGDTSVGAVPVEDAGDRSADRETSSRDSTDQTFVLRNNTGQTIMRAFVSPVTSNNWEEDVLGRDVLPDRQTLRINFDRGEAECNWDIKVELADGSTREQRGMNLCRLAEVEVTG